MSRTSKAAPAADESAEPSAVERWRADLASIEPPPYMMGRAAGREWALARASYFQLERLGRCRDRMAARRRERRPFFPEMDPANPHSRPDVQLAAAIGHAGGGDVFTNDASLRFFPGLGVPEALSLSHDWLHGFADGAADTFASRKAEIRAPTPRPPATPRGTRPWTA